MKVRELICILGRHDPNTEVFWIDTMNENQLSPLRDDHVTESLGDVVDDGRPRTNKIVLGRKSPGFFSGGGW